MFGLGPTELIVILSIVLLFFGATRVPQVARSFGQGLREFREGAPEVAHRQAVPPPEATLCRGPDGSRPLSVRRPTRGPTRLRTTRVTDWRPMGA